MNISSLHIAKYLLKLCFCFPFIWSTGGGEPMEIFGQEPMKVPMSTSVDYIGFIIKPVSYIGLYYTPTLEFTSKTNDSSDRHPGFDTRAKITFKLYRRARDGL